MIGRLSASRERAFKSGKQVIASEHRKTLASQAPRFEIFSFERENKIRSRALFCSLSRELYKYHSVHWVDKSESTYHAVCRKRLRDKPHRVADCISFLNDFIDCKRPSVCSPLYDSSSANTNQMCFLFASTFLIEWFTTWALFVIGIGCCFPNDIFILSSDEGFLYTSPNCLRRVISDA